MKQVISSSKVDTIIFAVDTLQYSFGSFGNKDELSVIKQPSHAKLFELSTKQATAERILHYAPKDGFLGIDSVVVLSKRILEAANPFIKIDSVLIIIRNVRDITHKNLIGKWILTSICGGFTGGCDSVYPNNATQIEFDYNMGYTEQYRGSITKNLNYYLVDSTWRPYICVIDSYENRRFKRYFGYYPDHLVEQTGDSFNRYSRLKE